MQQHSHSSDSQDGDTLYQENLVYVDFGAQHEQSSHFQQQQDQEQEIHHPADPQQAYANFGLASHSSSSSLGQISATQQQLRSSPIAIVRPPSEKASGEPTGFETDEDDDSEIDVVERDAMRLRRKYGDKVMAKSYQPGMAQETSTSSMLMAPYLGSLSKSENFLMSLPPISLSDENTNYQYGEPPSEITSYGSLRESHQRGKFLDGPSSYREPRSGQIRRLDRLGRPGAAGLSKSHQPSMSIGERIQQAQKQKKDETGVAADVAGASTLAMMMDEASKNPQSGADEAVSEFESFKLGATTVVAPHELSAFDADEAEVYDKFDPPTMMSTSLTAFEVLHAASSVKMAGYERNHTQRFVQQQQGTQRFVQQHQHGHISAASASTHNNNITTTTSSVLPSEAAIREQHFQPLSRSLSDPTPHHLQRSPMLAPTLQQPGGAYWPHHHAYGLTAMDHSAAAQHAAALGNNATTAPDQLDNPDTDEAFDMDME